jgi:hypothetical protein
MDNLECAGWTALLKDGEVRKVLFLDESGDTVWM